MAELAPATDDRRLALAGTYNVRHVGGYPAAAGGVVAPRLLWRGDALHALDADGCATLAGLPLRTVVDLREPAERDQRPNRLDGTGARLRSLPLYEGTLETAADVDWPAVRRGDLAALYLVLARRHGRQIARAVGALAEPGALPGIVHCTAGKDRTGIVVALLLSALGVADEHVLADFALTERYLDDRFVADVRGAVQGAAVGAAGGDALADRVYRAAEPAWIAGVLADVRARHGDAAAYLTDHGLDPAALDALRVALITTTPDEGATDAHA